MLDKFSKIYLNYVVEAEKAEKPEAYKVTFTTDDIDFVEMLKNTEYTNAKIKVFLENKENPHAEEVDLNEIEVEDLKIDLIEENSRKKIHKDNLI